VLAADGYEVDEAETFRAALDLLRTRRPEAVIASCRLRDESRHAREPVNPFLGTSPAIQELAERARRALVGDRPVLIRGETGTGKGVPAEWLHEHGARSGESFLDLNCAGLSRELLETELFGHEKGAFTGAVAAKIGLLEAADRGTLFLDGYARSAARLKATARSGARGRPKGRPSSCSERFTSSSPCADRRPR